jgi:hypothetical protein
LTELHPSSTAPEAEAQLSGITRLAQALAAARLQSANRLAAIRAALGAAADGETDPLAYLRDQLAEEAGTRIPESGR